MGGNMKKQLLALGILSVIFCAQNLGAQLVDNGDGTITDYARHLMWIKNANDDYKNTSLTFAEAQQYIIDLNNARFAGYSDWRLPAGMDPASDPAGTDPELHPYYYGCSSSELGYFYYILCGCSGGYGLDRIPNIYAPGGWVPNPNPVPRMFQNLYLSSSSSDIYWTGIMTDSAHTWTFEMRSGAYKLQPTTSTYRLRAWPVRDVSNLPPIDMDLWIKDCNADSGEVPSVPTPCDNSYTSPDIYIDNNDDNQIDSPAFGLWNRLKAIIRNRGKAWSVNSQVEFYYFDSSVGFDFPEDAHLIGSVNPGVVQVNSELPTFPLTVAAVGCVLPQPPEGAHYCFFVRICDEYDEPKDPYPGVAQDNNVASVNDWYIAQRAAAGESVTLSFTLGSGFGFGLTPWPRTFIIRVKGQLPKDWSWKPEGFSIDKPYTLKLGEKDRARIRLNIPKDTKSHSNGYIELIQEDVLTKRVVGGLRYNIYEDHIPPKAVEGLKIENVKGKAVLSWAPIKAEAEGEFKERVLYYEVFRNGKYTKKVAMDEDTSRPGMQWTDPDGVVGSLSYSLRAVDEAGNISAKSQDVQISIPKPTEGAQEKPSLFNWLTWVLLIILLATIFLLVTRKRRA
jgi:hypothetical protein